MDAIDRLRVAGWIEGASCLALFGIAMPLKYAAGMPLAVRIVGSVHGGLFLLVCALLAHVAWTRRWSIGRIAAVLVATIVPFGPFVIDRRVRRWGDEPR